MFDKPVATLLKYLSLKGLRRCFYRVAVAGEQAVVELKDQKEPFIACPNHNNWWDGLVVLQAMEGFPYHQVRLLQKQEHYKNTPWFSVLGTRPLRLQSSRETGIDLRKYLRELQSTVGGAGTKEKLTQPIALWLFPEGELRSAEAGLAKELFPGAAWLSRKSSAPIIPLGIRYVWEGQSRPSVLLRWGRALDVGKVTPELLREKIAALLEQIDADAAGNNLSEYRSFYPARPSINERWRQLKDRFRRS